ncbi:unnamed protein product [Cuscuta epithymum]|uniref:RING-type E3 ubiquitin transferase n=1 Tax=Cuscuta epithymum TaxID=186058 RepID=A0AAV0FMR2_9ASTE|nr:unnamed protein product [Cuscuta epithymum]
MDPHVKDAFRRDDLQMDDSTSRKYELGGKIMLSAIVILFAIVVFIAALHLYGRWYILRQRRRDLRRRRNRNLHAQIVFYIDNNDPASAHSANRGLDQAVIQSLPVLEYSPANRVGLTECAVCLSEFEENEKGRLLPKCNHTFHIECIDMWFHSHATCPLCRTPVEAFHGPEETAVTDTEPVAGNGTGPSTTSEFCRDENATTTSLGSRRKGFDFTAVRLQVPTRNELNPELEQSSPASYAFRSPGSRLMSLKNILSMNKRTSSGPSTPLPVSTELDLECGGRVSESTRRRTPR